MFIEGKTSVYNEEQNLNRMWLSNEFLKVVGQIEEKNNIEDECNFNLEIEFIETAKAFYEGKKSNFSMLDSSEVYNLVLKTVDFNKAEYINFFEYTKKIVNEIQLVKKNQFNNVDLLIRFLKKVSNELKLEAISKRSAHYLIDEDSDYYEFIE